MRPGKPSGQDIEQVLRAADRAAGLTHQLLSFARREVVQPRVLDLNETVASVEQLLRRTLGEHVELMTVLAGDLCPVLADPGQIEQVLVNLAVNARDAMPGGGKLTIETANTDVDQVYAADQPGLAAGRYVTVKVSDTGTGMSPRWWTGHSSRSTAPSPRARDPASGWRPCTGSSPRPGGVPGSIPSLASARPSGCCSRSPTGPVRCWPADHPGRCAAAARSCSSWRTRRPCGR